MADRLRYPGEESSKAAIYDGWFPIGMQCDGNTTEIKIARWPLVGSSMVRVPSKKINNQRGSNLSCDQT